MKDQFTKFPSLIPPDYIAKTVDSLLPRVDINKLSGQALRLYAARKDELTQAITSDPVSRFHPTPGGQYDFMSCSDDSVQGLYFFAGNKTGKTTAAAILVAENACGQPLWDRATRSIRDLLLRGRTPLRMCAFCEDFSTHEQVIVPTLLSWMPRWLLANDPIERGPSGNLTCIRFASGTHLYLRTYDQGYAKAEGKDYDLVWCDEPPPREIYTAIGRGLITTRGRLVIAATLLSEIWLYDELAQPFVKVFEATMYDNPWLDNQWRDNYAMQLTEEEKLIRLHGKPSSLTGKIYPSFTDKPPFVLPLPEGMRLWDPIEEEPYPVILGIDPHERKGLYCEWGWLTPEDKIVWFKWEIIPTSGARITDIFKRLVEIDAENNQEVRLVVIDPNSGPRKQIDGLSWSEALEEHGYEVMLGNDKVNAGHVMLGDYLSTSEPRMMWLESCQGVGGPIHQMLRYAWDEYSRALRHERGPKERVKQTHKDFPDIHRYVAMARLEYRVLAGRGYEPITIAGRDERRGSNPYVR